MKRKLCLLLMFCANFMAYGQHVQNIDLEGIWVNREQEMQMQKLQLRANSCTNICLGNILKELFDINVAELEYLNVLKNNQLVTIEDNKEIIDYDILSPVKLITEQGDLRFDGSDYILSVGYNHKYGLGKEDKSRSKMDNTIILYINNASGIYGKSVYRSVVVCYPSNLIERNIIGDQIQHRTYSFLIAYDYQAEEQAKQRYNGIVTSINTKLEEKQDSLLTQTEQELLSFVYPDLQYNFYMGNSALKEK